MTTGKLDYICTLKVYETGVFVCNHNLEHVGGLCDGCCPQNGIVNIGCEHPNFVPNKISEIPKNVVKAIALKRLINLFPDCLNEDNSVKSPKEYTGYEDGSMGYRMGPGEDYMFIYNVYTGGRFYEGEELEAYNDTLIKELRAYKK